tara:strand:+ start:7624 stop:8340 length:717 start_codon:yes stop_codon:yes gene_type:complete
MKRRESIKTMILSTIGASLALESCISPEGENVANKIWKYRYGRTPYEKERDEKFLNAQFFNNQELKTIEKIANIIIPPNEFGNIKDAGVVEMIEFIAKDWSTPAHNNYGENVLRKGLSVLDKLFIKKFNTSLVDSTDEEIKSIFDKISFNDNNDESLSEATGFFATYRYMVVTGWFTSEVGMKDLGFKGNIPNVWDGVPEEVLKEHNVSYDEEWISKCVDQTKRNETAVWDEDGNLLT